MSILCISGNTPSIQTCMNVTLHCCLLIIHLYSHKSPHVYHTQHRYRSSYTAYVTISLYLFPVCAVLCHYSSPIHVWSYKYGSTWCFSLCHATAYSVLTISCIWLIISLFIPNFSKGTFFLNYLLPTTYSVIGSNN